MGQFTAKLDARLFKQHLKQLDTQALPIVSKHLYLEAEDIIGDAKELYAPVDTGALRSSGHARLPTVRGRRVSVELGFGGAAAGYALYVHEDLNARHPVGQAKYLEVPFRQKATGIPARLAARLSQEIKRIFRGR